MKKWFVIAVLTVGYYAVVSVVCAFLHAVPEDAALPLVCFLMAERGMTNVIRVN